MDNNTDVMYSVAAAVRPVDPRCVFLLTKLLVIFQPLLFHRDFVSVRRRERKNGIYYVASASVEFDGKPPVGGRVR